MAPRKGSKRKIILGYGSNKVPRTDTNKYARELYQRLKKHDPKFLKARNAKYQRNFRDRLREDLFTAYGSKCQCCGETNPGFLTIDHVNGGGLKHRRKLGGSQRIYCEIRRRGYPKEFRLLCYNCNCGRAHSSDGRCPHERERQAAVAS